MLIDLPEEPDPKPDPAPVPRSSAPRGFRPPTATRSSSAPRARRHDPPGSSRPGRLGLRRGLDLTPLYDRIKAVERQPGRPPIDPKILMALWLYATIEGVGSARQLDELCREHAAFQWIAGDVSTNYHTLADFRTDHVELLDDLLTQSVAALMAEGLVDLNRVAQDGMRVRASAGAASFRRRPTLEEALAEAEAQVEALRAEVEDDPAATDRRQKAARRAGGAGAGRADQGGVGAVAGAGGQEEARGEGQGAVLDDRPGGHGDEDGRRRVPPGVQLPVRHGHGQPGDRRRGRGDDRQRRGPDGADGGADRRRDTRRCRASVLVDGGFAQHDQIEAVSAPEMGCTVYAPVPKPKDPQVDRHAPKPGDSAAVAAWRQRMATEQAKAIYKDRAATAECVNALARAVG